MNQGFALPLLAFAGALFAASAANSSAADPAPAATPPALEGDPENYQAMLAVCTSCHTAEMFSGEPRGWARWTDIFTRMTRHGMEANQEQIDRVVTYFLENLTVVNVNSSSADELSVVLGVEEPVSAAIVARREQRKFKDLAELSSFPGVDASVVKRRGSRIQF
jgi:hypothetical protein